MEAAFLGQGEVHQVVGREDILLVGVTLAQLVSLWYLVTLEL